MTEPHIEWTTLDRWQTVNLVGFKQPGLIRFLLDGEVVFIAYAASPETGVGARIGAYRRCGAGKDLVERRIARHRDDLDLQFCFLDQPRDRIRALRDQLVKRDKPAWNTPNGYRGRI